MNKKIKKKKKKFLDLGEGEASGGTNFIILDPFEET